MKWIGHVALMEGLSEMRLNLRGDVIVYEGKIYSRALPKL
jgi:hypothetical protein